MQVLIHWKIWRATSLDVWERCGTWEHDIDTSLCVTPRAHTIHIMDKIQAFLETRWDEKSTPKTQDNVSGRILCVSMFNDVDWWEANMWDIV